MWPQNPEIVPNTVHYNSSFVQALTGKEALPLTELLHVPLSY
jgi:hypothetical protein